MGEQEPKEFMDTVELAAWLGVPEYTVTREAREGRLPGRKVGRGWRFSRTAILEYFRGSDAETRGRRSDRAIEAADGTDSPMIE